MFFFSEKKKEKWRRLIIDAKSKARSKGNSYRIKGREKGGKEKTKRNRRE